MRAVALVGLLSGCTINMPTGTDPAVMTSYFGLLGTVVTVVIAPISMAICTWFLNRGQKKLGVKTEATAQLLSEKTEQVAQRLSEKTEQIAQTLSDKGDEHKTEIVKEARAAYTEANDLNVKMNKVYERLEATEKARSKKPVKK